MMRIALVTSRKFPQSDWRDVDLPFVVDGLVRRGALVDTVAWDEGASLGGYDAVVLTSPWSMWHQLPPFARWLDARVDEGVNLLNPADVVRLGSDKRYLLALAAAGVPVVPTTLIEGLENSGEMCGVGARELEASLRDALPPAGSPRRTIVVKPLAGGGAMGTGEFASHELDEAAAHVRRFLAAGTPALVQPYLAAIDRHRELGVVTLNGEISHAVTKAAIIRPHQADRAFHPDPRPYHLTDSQREVVDLSYRALLTLLPDSAPAPLSVRLDFVVDPDSPAGLVLLEIEMVAPVRFFAQVPGACDRYVAAILARVDTGA